MVGFGKQLKKLINQAFDKAGLSFIPVFVRFILVAAILLSPLIAIVFVICCQKDANDENAVNAAAAMAAMAACNKVADNSSPTGKKKREKIE